MSRPKRIFTDEQVNKILQLYQEGKTDLQVAKVFKVGRKTFLKQVKNIQDLSSTIKKIKETPDSKVEKSLFERALGYTHEDTQFFCHQGVIISKEYVKRYPPDVSACVFWLCNRQPGRWKNVQKVDIDVPGGVEIVVKEAKKVNSKASA